MERAGDKLNHETKINLLGTEDNHRLGGGLSFDVLNAGT